VALLSFMAVGLEPSDKEWRRFKHEMRQDNARAEFIVKCVSRGGERKACAEKYDNPRPNREDSGADFYAGAAAIYFGGKATGLWK